MPQPVYLPDTHDLSRGLLRHVVATIAYRASKVLRDIPPGFAAWLPGPKTRRPVQIVAHLADLMLWAITLARGENVWNAGGSGDWDAEVQRFYAAIAALDAELSIDEPLVGSAEKLLQGPLADALTHVGQLAILRGMAGASVRPENYVKADVMIGRVGLDQPPPKREFDGDASGRRS
jgi:hypothetical protein